LKLEYLKKGISPENSTENEVRNNRISGIIRSIDMDTRKFKIKPKGYKKTIPIYFSKEYDDIVAENKINSKVTIDIKNETFLNKEDGLMLKKFVNF